MNEQFQQVYDYLQSSGQLSEGTTQDSFYQKYSSSDSDFNKLYQRLSSREDLPFDLYDQEQFRADLFSVEGEAPLKKKTQEESFQQVSPSVQASTASTSDSGTLQPDWGSQYYNWNELNPALQSAISNTSAEIPVDSLGGDIEENFEIAVSAKKNSARQNNIDWTDALMQLEGAYLNEDAISRIEDELNPGGWRYIANNSGITKGDSGTWNDDDLSRIRDAMAISDFKENYVYQDPESGNWMIGERDIPEEDLLVNRGSGDYYNFKTDKTQQFRWMWMPGAGRMGTFVKTWDYETDYLTGRFGDFINSIPFLGDFIDDTARAIGQGYTQTETYDPTRALMADVNEETVMSYYNSAIEIDNRIKAMGESDEMIAYQDDYARYSEEYGEWWGWFAAGFKNPQVFWESTVKSMSGMIEDEVLAEGSKVVTVGTGTGAAIGSSFAGIGAVPGAIEGFSYSLPFAMAAMGKEVEVINSFNQFLREEIEAKGYEFSPESVLEVLSDEEAYGRITSKARARGNTVMFVDAVAGGVSSGAFRALRAAGKIGEAGVITRQSVVDLASGSTGEALAEVAAGQEISAEDILLEGFTGPLTQTPVNVTSSLLGNEPVNTVDGAGPSGFRIMPAIDNLVAGGPNPTSRYVINGEVVTKNEFSDFIETEGPDVLLSDRLSLQVFNDQETANRLNEVVEKTQIESTIPDDITGDQRQRLVEAEVRLKRLEGVETKTAKRSRKEIEAEIDGILDDYLQGLEMAEITPVMTRQKKGEFTGYMTNVLKGETGQFAHMTAENPGTITFDSEENAKRNEQLKKDLIEMGYTPVEIDGKYGNPEKSFFVEGITVDDAIKLGEKYGQESVAHSEGMLYTTGDKKGMKNPVTGELTVDDNLDDFYSVMKTDEGDVKYRVEYDWENLEQIAESPTQEQREQAAAEYREKLIEEDVYLRNRKGVKGVIDDVLTGKTKIQRRLFSARRFMPRSAFKATEAREAAMSSRLNQLEKRSKDFERLEMSIADDQRDAFYADFDNVLRGGERGGLSNESYLLATQMRSDIDNLSIDLINSGLIDESQIDVVASNLGEYMNIAYAAYDQPGKWKDYINTSEAGMQTKNKAHAWLKKNDKDLIEKSKKEFYSQDDQDKQKVAASNATTEAEYLDYLVEGKIQAMLDTDTDLYSKDGQIKSGDKNVLKRRKDIPEEISQLLGRYDDPLQSYVRTTHKLASLNEAVRFNNSIIETGLNSWLFETPQGQKFSSEVKVGERTLYTTPEIAKELNNQYRDRIFEGEAIDFMLKFSGAAKWMKTIGSVGTHSKNVVGNLGFMVANGHLSASTAADATKAFQTVYTDLRSLPNAELRKRMQKYIDLGIVKQSTGLGEIKDILAADDFESAAQSRLDKNSRNRIEKGFQSTKKGLEDLYQAEDDFFKIMAYESESRRYSEALFGLQPDQLTEQQLTDLNDQVAEIVKNTFPTYSRVPSAIEFLKRNPLIGNFISFQAESYRTAWNILDLAQQEIKSDNPAVRKIGLQRMAGATSYMAAKTAILSGGSVAAGMGAYGLMSAGEDQTEEERQRESDIRRFVPFWSEDSELYMTSPGVIEGEFSYVDFSASDPWGGIDKVVNSYQKGEGFVEGLANTLGTSIEPFVGADIASRRVLNLIEGRDDYGRDIWLEDDTNDEKFVKAMEYMYGVFEPGTFTSFRKVANSDDPYNELMGQMSGYKNVNVSVKDQMFYKLRDHGEYLRQDLGVRYEDLQEGRETFEVESYREAIDKMKTREALIREDVMAASRLGVDISDLIEMMRTQLNVSKEKAESILVGDFIAPSVTPSNR
jgi:hypothetical protein